MSTIDSKENLEDVLAKTQNYINTVPNGGEESSRERERECVRERERALDPPPACLPCHNADHAPRVYCNPPLIRSMRAATPRSS